jgi:hypothetical protein
MGTVSINNLELLTKRLQYEIRELEKQLDEKRDQLRSVAVTVGLMTNAPPAPPAHSNISAASLHGLSQRDALIRIAAANKGLLITRAAKSLMLRAGLIKNAKNASPIIFNIIAKSGLFERIGPGEYQMSLPKMEQIPALNTTALPTPMRIAAEEREDALRRAFDKD